MNRPIKILHFADAHIDMVNYGKHDERTRLPIRVMDFLSSLDQIVERAIEEKVDLVIFAGDAYRNQRPHPKFQRQWEQRIVQLSRAGIPTVLIVGNHDTSPSVQRAHAMQEFATLNVANVFVVDNLQLLTAEQLGLPVQVVALPWVSQSALMARFEASSDEALRNTLEERIGNGLDQMIAKADPELPTILTAHVTVQGAKFGSERQVMLGQDVALSMGVVKDPRLDYVALGHIHKHQEIGTGHPPVLYSGSIERVDFGEVKETKGFVLAEVSKGDTTWKFVPLKTRRFVDISVKLETRDLFMPRILEEIERYERVIPKAICRLQLFYPREWEMLLDEAEIGRYFKHALSFQIAKHRSAESRSRLGDTVAVESLTPEELLSTYWQTSGLDAEEAGEMQHLAKEVFGQMLVS
ncbi:MAG: metallophosphoesterase family protein [Candidatus Promineifilaceae bacterium]